jgi:transcriptional regulator with XRE-family HTH domain
MGSIQTFGNVVRDLRLRHGLTQLQLAELASVSERTIRSAEKNQRISCTHVTYIADALGVAPVHIARAPIVTADGMEPPATHRIWEVMFGRASMLGLESLLHREIQIQSCGEVADFPRPEQFFRKYAGIRDCVLFFERISDYLNSIGPISVRTAELCKSPSAMALQGTISGTSSSGSPNCLRLLSFVILEEGKVQTLLNHIASVVDRDFDWEKKAGKNYVSVNRSDPVLFP